MKHVFHVDPRKPFLNWDDLKYFLAVARIGTLRGGADSIQVNHTTLTRRLSVMEERVGSRLFDRSKQGLVLTQLGEDLMPHAERVEAEMSAASRVIVGRDAQPSGTVYITLPHGLAMTSLMDDFTAFADLYPDIILNMNFTNDIRDLTRREADVSLRVASEVTDDVVAGSSFRCPKQPIAQETMLSGSRTMVAKDCTLLGGMSQKRRPRRNG